MTGMAGRTDRTGEDTGVGQGGHVRGGERRLDGGRVDRSTEQG
jgi:hypothetical protein